MNKKQNKSELMEYLENLKVDHTRNKENIIPNIFALPEFTKYLEAYRKDLFARAMLGENDSCLSVFNRLLLNSYKYDAGNVVDLDEYEDSDDDYEYFFEEMERLYEDMNPVLYISKNDQIYRDLVEYTNKHGLKLYELLPDFVDFDDPDNLGPGYISKQDLNHIAFSVNEPTYQNYDELEELEGLERIKAFG